MPWIRTWNGLLLALPEPPDDGGDDDFGLTNKWTSGLAMTHEEKGLDCRLRLEEPWRNRYTSSHKYSGQAL